MRFCLCARAIELEKEAMPAREDALGACVRETSRERTQREKARVAAAAGNPPATVVVVVFLFFRQVGCFYD
jgi:hypothetical protein